MCIHICNLCTTHLSKHKYIQGWHSRYVSDYGILLNYARTGVDPLDGDTIQFKFEDPAKINPKTLNVLLIGKGGFNSFGVTGHKWESERLALVRQALEEAGVNVVEKTADEAKSMWSWDESDELWHAFYVHQMIGIFSYVLCIYTYAYAYFYICVHYHYHHYYYYFSQYE